MSHVDKYILIMDKNRDHDPDYWLATKNAKATYDQVKAQTEYADESENVPKDGLRRVYCGKHTLRYTPNNQPHSGNIYKLKQKT